MPVADRLAAGPLAPLRHREFRLLWTGMSTSLVGNGILLVALAWQVYELAGTPAAMSAVGVALSLPQVVTLLAGGVVSDRFDPRRVMVISDPLSAVLFDQPSGGRGRAGHPAGRRT